MLKAFFFSGFVFFTLLSLCSDRQSKGAVVGCYGAALFSFLWMMP